MLPTENPWLKLDSAQTPFVLQIDHGDIARYNQAVRDPSRKVIVGSIPEPFIGNPASAKLVLLNLNPGHSEGDRHWHSQANFKDAMFKNLRRETQPYPFYPLNPAFAGNGAGQWWRPLTRALQEASGLSVSTFAERLLVIEWFPYHSERSALPPKLVCESQEYSFQLAKQMLDNEKVQVVGMRSRKHWLSVDQGFTKVPFLKNAQRPFITRGNMEGNVFDEILKVLQATD
jgi:hypothetical protein